MLPPFFKYSKMKQPSKEAQQELISIDQNLPSIVEIPRSKKKYKITWLKPYTTNRVSQSFLENEVPEELKDGADTVKFMAKKVKVVSIIASYVILNNFWTIKFFHGLHWRWLFYVKQYDYEQLLPIIVEGKKKMGVQGYYVSMALAATMMDTLRMMMKTEAEQYLAELSSAQNQPSERSTLGL